jgi:hypothetical protein
MSTYNSTECFFKIGMDFDKMDPVNDLPEQLTSFAMQAPSALALVFFPMRLHVRRKCMLIQVLYIRQARSRRRRALEKPHW